MIRKIALIGLALVVISAIAAAVAYSQFTRWLDTPLAFSDGSAYRVERGDSVSTIARTLQDQNAANWPEVWVRPWIIYARVNKLTQIKKGEYLLSATDTPRALLEKFVEGDVILHRLVFIEGKRFKDYLAQLSKHEQVKSTLTGLTVEQILTQLDTNITHPEGWFLPETYTFVEGTTDLEILQMAHNNMQATLDALWPKRQSDLPYENPYEALIMASIVEKETGVPEERGEIAGVFVRRLRAGMRLQTDPTVIYGMGDAYIGNIRRKDLRTPTAYNTYTIQGLPPTPIAMPGRDAIYAALHPKDGTSLFFVAKGDGSHYFSDTYEEHSKAVKEFQLKRKSNYRSAPLKSQ